MTTPTATIFVPYHALDEVHQRGTRAAQPAATAVVPGTLYSVTDEGNALERSDGSAWARYASTGGDQTLDGDVVFATNSVVRRNTVDGADTGYTALVGGGAHAFTRGAAVAVTGNEFPLQPGTILLDVGVDGVVRVRTESATSVLTIDATGRIFEQGRTTALGAWTDIPFTAADFVASTAGTTWTVTSVETWAYTQVGETVTLSLTIAGTSTITGAPVRVQALLPASLGVTPRNQGAPFTYLTNGVPGTGLCQTFAGLAVLDFIRDANGTPFAAGPLYLAVTMSFAVA